MFCEVNVNDIRIRVNKVDKVFKTKLNPAKNMQMSANTAALSVVIPRPAVVYQLLQLQQLLQTLIVCVNNWAAKTFSADWLGQCLVVSMSMPSFRKSKNFAVQSFSRRIVCCTAVQSMCRGGGDVIIDSARRHQIQRRRPQNAHTENVIAVVVKPTKMVAMPVMRGMFVYVNVKVIYIQ